MEFACHGVLKVLFELQAKENNHASFGCHSLSGSAALISVVHKNITVEDISKHLRQTRLDLLLFFLLCSHDNTLLHIT